MNTAVSFREALRVWLKIAAYSFGGPAGQMAVMHRLLVEETGWISEKRFLHALNYCMLLPGPEAQQLATYTGWLLHGVRGGLVAGTLFILPGFLSILLLSVLYAGFQELALVQALFYGLKPAVMAIVVAAVVRIGSRALTNAATIGLALAAFVAIFFFDVPFPLIVLGAGVLGLIGGRLRPRWFGGEGVEEGGEETAVPAQAPSLTKAVRTLLIGLLIWFGPIALLALWLGGDHVFVTIGLFFSKMAVVTFGGAYAALAYVAQEAVEVYGWLQPGEMLDGLGMAETTPGPLIQVVQFVGFMGAYRQPGTLSPMLAGVLGAIITTWATFVPCFLWIFLGAPYIEYLRGNRFLSSALTGITAAVVGVILNLALWFSLQTLFGTVNIVPLGPARLQIPVWATLDWAALLIAIAAFIALFRYKRAMLETLAASAGVGLVYYLLFLN